MLRQRWLNTLNNENDPELWNLIKWNGKMDPIITHTSPSADALLTHFQSKTNTDEDTLLTDIINNPNHNNYIEILDKVKDAVNKLKNGKVTCDGWTPYMINSISDVSFGIIIIIFNVILFYRQVTSQHFGERLWYLLATYKNKGSSSEARNYRSISLVHMLKVFDFMRFKQWFTPHDCQTAYQQKRSCADNIFLLRSLIS